ncbi:signal transduction histidine kinase [Nitrospirillum amazonense]|uniref:histidine kinase n=1 Tax=Nitrospirillum amazonense TaxID=28077 RepID=A0A560EK22_9PROT|nr:ATP-binding protein [Nitrospirillum amazonense]TWB09687.1 signal transduction histidine kinase [Nitrospirillum amazonense]
MLATLAQIWRHRSLQGRLAWRLGLLFLASVAVGILPLVVRLEEAGGVVQRKVLRGQANELMAVFNHGGLSLDRLPPDLANRYALEEDGVIYAVWDQHGRLLTQSLPRAANTLREALNQPDTEYFFRPPGEPERYGLGTPIKLGDRTLTLAVAQSPTADQKIINGLLDEFVRDILLFGIPVALIAAAIGVWTIRSSLTPIQEVSEEAAAIGLDRLDHRLDGKNLPSEVLPLVDAFNTALARLEGSFRHHRRFIADAAHQLRTPLAVVQARLESGEADMNAVRADVRRLSRLVAQLLSLSRLSGTPLPRTDRVMAGELTAGELVTLAPFIRSLGKSIELEVVEDFPLVCNTGAVAEALRNLVENAVAYGPAGGMVEVRVGPGSILSVADRGPGLQGEDPLTLAEPFVRGAAGAGITGSGLGLAIAMEIMRQHGGRLAARDRHGGGALFSLCFEDKAA